MILAPMIFSDYTWSRFFPCKQEKNLIINKRLPTAVKIK